jgi:parallel beta-helix repeat protein
MPTRTVRRLTTVTLALAAALTWVSAAHAAGTVNIDSCQTLSIPNTVYKLTANLVSCGDCLVVAADGITIDLQGHVITTPGCPPDGPPFAAITDLGLTHDRIVVRNGTVAGYSFGVGLGNSTRVSVLGVTAENNAQTGIQAGPQSLVKSSQASGNQVGIFLVGPRGQVQQSNAHDNTIIGIAVFGDNCLITANTANTNGPLDGIVTLGNRCTISFNTASNNAGRGISAGGGSGHLVTGNVALNNALGLDYEINCPSTMTNNESTNGFPVSYLLNGTDCHLVNNK